MAARPGRVWAATRAAPPGSFPLNAQPPAGPPPAHRRKVAIALGAERIGLIGLRHRSLALAAALLLAVVAAFGVARLRVDDSLSQLFRSDTPQFRQYEEVTRSFPSNEYDVLVVVTGDDLLARGSLEHLRDLATDLQLVDGTKGIISLFSARQAPEPGHTVPPALFPEPLPEGPAFDALIAKVRANEIIQGKLLSEDGHLALMVLSLDPSGEGHYGPAIAEIRKTLGDDLRGTDLRGELSGVPVMQLEIRDAVERDRVLYNAVGFALGCLIAILFFRRVSFMVVAAGPPLFAILLALGTLGWLGFRLNMFLNVMTPLIMVISFSDSMQLTFAARDRLMAGAGKPEAFRDAVLVVGPACVLTHATAALSFTALLFTTSDSIRAFGEAGLISTAIALLAVLLLVPVLGVLLVRRVDRLAAAPSRGGDAGVQALRRFCAFVAARMVSHPGLYSALGVVVVAGLALAYSHLQPSYRLAEQVPDKEQAVQASGELDRQLTGANPIDVLIRFPAGETLYSARTLGVIAAVQKTVEDEPGIGNVWSLQTLRRWLAQKAGDDSVATLQKYVGFLPKYLVRRFIAEDQGAVLVTGRVPDKDASQLLPVVDALDAHLDAVRAADPGYEIAVTGLAVIAARNSASMIDKLNRGLTFEFLLVAAFIGLAFRSPVVGLAAVMPGIFPVVASGALLLVLGEGLQFVSVVALTVSFGLGLSATIHFLNRLRQEDDPRRDPAEGVERATVLMGPALILTSVVLACGLAVTVFSDLPSLRLFGWLSAFAMLAALTADFLILRPTMTFLVGLARRFGGGQIGTAAAE